MGGSALCGNYELMPWQFRLYSERHSLPLQPDGTSQTTFTYDLVGRQTGMHDPDRGTESSTYDPDGNLLTLTDGRG